MSAVPFSRLGLAALLVGAAAPARPLVAQGTPEDAFAWPEPTATARPWTRWWWLGSAVDAPNLQRLLSQYHDAGLGGVEICPIYGARGFESRFIDYLSPKWMDMLAVTTGAADRLGMGVDMTTGTGWPMGGPWIPADQASESVSLRRITVGPDGRIDGADLLSPWGTLGKSAAMDGGIRQQRSGVTVVCVRAVGPDNAQRDLTKYVHDGRLGWTAPGPGWSVYSLNARKPVQRVKRAAPGGAGYVVDPFSIRAVDTFLARFDEAFKGFRGVMPRAQFHDSFEYFGANWTPDLFAEFARRSGYDLREHLGELAGDGDAETASRVRQDFRQTLGALHQAYVARWTSWSHSHGSLTREQAHGAPANIEDIYAAADIPETEGSFGGGDENQVPMLTFASSAAHVTGRNLVSSETFTWLGEHFQVPLSQLKGVADTFLLAGINHMFLHGIPYSPADAPWPGWLFYASVDFGPSGGLWRDLPAFTAYVTRCQSILQSGKPDNDVLLYFPVADFWQRKGPGTEGTPSGNGADLLVLPFGIPGTWIAGSAFHQSAMELWHRGYAYDQVTDALLLGARVDTAAPGEHVTGMGIRLGGHLYRAIVIPPCHYIPVDTLRFLLDLSRRGASIVFAGDLPTDVPGLGRLASRRAELRALLDAILLKAFDAGRGAAAKEVRSARFGSGLILSGCAHPYPAGGDISSLLDSAGIAREPMVDDGLHCIRRARDGGFDYFIVNTGRTPVEKWVELARPALAAVLLDPLNPGRTGVAAIRAPGDSSSVFLQMAPGQSLVLRTFTGSAPHGPAWHYQRLAPAAALILKGAWSIHFVDGGPVLPKDGPSSLGSWTERDDPEAKRFSGSAVYRLNFTMPPANGVDDWRIDLGRVADSARVRLNGKEVATLWSAPFSADAGPFLLPGANVIEVEVTNVAANRIRDLDRRHVEWKRFYEINFVNQKYRPFDAAGWPVRDAGLLGPVVLTPLKPVMPEP